MAIEALDIEIKSNADGAKNAVDQLVSSFEKLRGSLGGVSSAAKAPADVGKAAGSSTKAIDALRNAVERAKSATTDQGRAAVEAATANTKAWTDSASAAKKFTEESDQIVKNLVEKARAAQGASPEAKALQAETKSLQEQAAAYREQADAARKAADESHARVMAADERIAKIKAETAALHEQNVERERNAIDDEYRRNLNLAPAIRGDAGTLYNWRQMQADQAAEAEQEAAAMERVARAEEIAAKAGYALGWSLRKVGQALLFVAKIAGKAALAVGRGIAGGFKALGRAVAAPFQRIGKFFNMIGRMALYRAIRSAIKMVAQGVKEGTENFAKWDYLTGQVSGANAIRTLNEYGNAFAQLKNSIGAAAMPIMQLLLPAIKAIISLAVQAANAIAALVSAIQGLSYFFGASADAGYDAADAYNAAGGGASKLKNTILGFDELNVLNDNSGGGGGGGSNVMSGIDEDTFIKMNIPEWIQYLLGKFREAWSDADFSFFGEILANRFNRVMNIDWKDVKKGVSKFVSSITTFINSFIRTADWGQVARNLSEGLVTALGGITQFIEQIDWGAVGTAIVDFFSNIDYKAIVEAVGALLRALISGIRDLLLPIVDSLLETIKNKWADFKVWILQNAPWLAERLGIDNHFEGQHGGHGSSGSAADAGGGTAGSSGHFAPIEFDIKLNLPPGGIEGFIKDVQADADKEKPIGLKANIKQVDPPSSTPTIDVKASIDANVSGLKTQIQNAVAGLQARLGFKPYLVNTDLFVKINSGFNSQEQKIGFRDITGYAEGGFPAAGLFFAGENGPELVGSIGGRTAVANSDQIIAGIASGVAAAMMGTGAKLDETNNLLRGMAERDSTVVVSTSDIAAGMSRMNRRAGATVMPVGA